MKRAVAAGALAGVLAGAAIVFAALTYTGGELASSPLSIGSRAAPCGPATECERARERLASRVAELAQTLVELEGRVALRPIGAPCAGVPPLGPIERGDDE